MAPAFRHTLLIQRLPARPLAVAPEPQRDGRLADAQAPQREVGHPVRQVRTWLHRYQQRGVDSLEDHPRSGRLSKDRLAGPIVDAQASQSPRCSGHVQPQAFVPASAVEHEDDLLGGTGADLAGKGG